MDFAYVFLDSMLPDRTEIFEPVKTVPALAAITGVALTLYASLTDGDLFGTFSDEFRSTNESGKPRKRCSMLLVSLVWHQADMDSGNAGLVDRNFDNRLAAIGLDPYRSFNERLALIFGEMQTICATSRGQIWCNTAPITFENE